MEKQKEQMDLESSNKLIAEFMGLCKADGFIVSDSGLPVSGGGYMYNCEFVAYDDLSYNSSWDWLMPVVEKIEKTPVKWSISSFKKKGWSKQNKSGHWYQVRIDGDCCDIYEGLSMVGTWRIELPHNDPYFKFIDTSKIYTVWLACVEFIKWYNKNK